MDENQESPEKITDLGDVSTANDTAPASDFEGSLGVADSQVESQVEHIEVNQEMLLQMAHGLNSSEADRLYRENGPNALPENPPPTDFALFILQFKNPLVYVLLAACLITVLLKEYTDAVVIFLAVIMNTVLGFLQERKAGKALEALKKLMHPSARVLRDGEIKTIDAVQIVSGDIVLLKQGDKIPADGVLFDVNRLYLSEAFLTGESVPVEKQLMDRAFMGSIVQSGTAKFAVNATGASTEIGKIAVSVSELGEDTPLRNQLKKFSKSLSLLVLGLTALVFIVGLVLGEDPVSIFTTSVALAVSAIPEGLLVALTIILAIGMQRILAKRGLVRNLVSAETLGSVTTICVDKTGTLTQGKMAVSNSFGNEDAMALQMMVANDIDDPVVIAGWEWGKERVQNFGFKDAKAVAENYKRLDSIPFSSAERIFVSLNSWDKGANVIFVNGAPEVILERCALDDSHKKELKEKIEQFSYEGKRLIALARKFVDPSMREVTIDDTKGDLEWVGILGFSDPVRPDVKESLITTQKAGIRVIVITGDYANTALAVLYQLGIEVGIDNVILGDDMAKMPDSGLRQKLGANRDVMLFARTKPDQKLKIVKVLKSMGEVVAMTGDGVNDAPALSQADIGVVVDEASDVAKESADLVLLDSNFSTIVEAIEEGRGIFDNIRKVILYLMSDAFIEILIVISALIARIPMPITAAQILWVNLVSDGFPDLALTVDPKVPGIMNRKPRPSSEPLVAHWMTKLIGIISLVGATLTFILYYRVLLVHSDPVLARSVAFAAVGVNSLVYVFSIRTLTDPFWEDGPFDNKWLFAAVAGGLVMQILPFVSEGFRGFFEIEPIGIYWAYVFGVALVMFLAIEIFKAVFRHHLKMNGHS